MTRNEIDLLIAAMRANGVTRLEWAQARKGIQLCLTLPEGDDLPPVPPVVAARALPVTSPGIGRFAPRGGDDGLPPLAPGATVRKGEPLGYISQGAVLQLLVAPADGILFGTIPEEGRVFGHGDRVLELEGETE